MTRRMQGVTLIELMVGIAIMAVVMASSVSLGADWVNEARVTEARSQMRLAYSKARALGIRNGNARTTDAAAWVCVASGVVYVYQSMPTSSTGPDTCGIVAGDAAVDDDGLIWRADLAGGIATTVETAAAANSTAFTCLGFGNRGLPVAVSMGATACTTDQIIYVKRGNSNEATTLN